MVRLLPSPLHFIIRFHIELAPVAMPPIVHVSPDKASLADALALWVAELSAKAIAERGQFAVAFSGGSLATILGGALCAEPHRYEQSWSGHALEPVADKVTGLW